MIRKIKIILVLFLFSASCFVGNGNAQKMDKSTIKELDLEKYLGTWYEIARYDHRFERGLQGVTATYSLREDGKIKVLNKGYKESLDGKLDVAEGKAKLTDETGKLKVSFFWIFYADYYILELDKDYQWALVGSKSDNYLWILSRTPKLSQEVKKHIINKVEERGYDTSKLIWVEQKSEK